MFRQLVILVSIMLSTSCARGENPPTSPPLTPCLAVDAAGRPIYPTPSFSSGGKWMNASFHLRPGESFTRLGCEWVTVDVGDVAAPGTSLATADLPITPQARDGGFNYSQSGPLPLGRYKLIVTADGRPWHEVEVGVHEDSPAMTLSSPRDLHPLIEGATWSYDFLLSAPDGIKNASVTADSDGKVRATVTVTVGPSEPDGVRLDYVRNGTPFQQEWWVPTSEGMMIRKRIVNGEQTVLSPPELVFAMPRGPMTEWTYPPASASGDAYRMWGPLPIETPDGERDGFIVVCKRTGPMTTTDTREYVPGIGMVRQRIVGSRDGSLAFESDIRLTKWSIPSVGGGAFGDAREGAPESAGGGAPSPGEQNTGGAVPAFRTVDNAELSEGIGRIVIAYPDGTDCGRTETKIFPSARAEKPLTWKFGAAAFEVMPGRYVVDIEGARVLDVEVAVRRDTIITVGALRVRAPAKTEVKVLDTTGKRLDWYFGSFEMGLPVGDYLLEFAGQTHPITIDENRITEFDAN